jgi:DNA-binding NarL/FixJ family response regulator
LRFLAGSVNFHLRNVYRKLGIGRRAGLTLALLDAGLVVDHGSLQEVSP